MHNEVPNKLAFVLAPYCLLLVDCVTKQRGFMCTWKGAAVMRRIDWMRLVNVGLLAALILIVSVTGFAEDRFFVMKGDLHLHTTFSHDGQGLPEQVIADSIVAGYDFVAFTEH